MEILYQDEYLLVCIKPSGVASDQLPQLLQRQLSLQTPLRTVHRLDQPVSGLMVLAKRKHTAADLSQQIRQGSFEKAYQAVIHGHPQESGTFRDLLGRDKEKRMTYVAGEPAKGVQEAVLDYTVLARSDALSRVRVRLHTGRTHQIRVQFASRGFPLLGDRRYGLGESCSIALYSSYLAFTHPKTGERMAFAHEPPESFPWSEV